ncbi:mitochondrial methylglutaconyl-CoA hydratase-like protein [Pseudovirgaria hyperparasitica]|uniref:Mitochondrial methylglutaconyl-CoA hydratase-like protein n=1 Tax=Pseudovirgaria hyperparasitica TaxID=470096 RepID=A0A6A6WAF4_9PEZI|nr:mitochondrial methylglutaconyl-CoA hydratase-like protein [Pseudovirgaria hyperparasitica]KAF2758101.1 mitochondrial methylglutaconyl-CoA hydratase-like protein [Pseudovirgaria hyperparasitica]
MPSARRLPRLCVPRVQPLNLRVRFYSTPSTPSVLKITSVPAPHCGSIRIISLNRPEARNAISRQLLAELETQIKSIAGEGADGPTRALILSSESDASFCAGADLKERKAMSQNETSAFLKQLRSTFALLASLPIPTLSSVSSLALGGGLELALCTHLRVFSSRAIVSLPETRLAILPGAGGTYRLPAIIGAQRARDLILTGRRVSAAEAYFLGLCDRLVEVTDEEARVSGKGRERVLEESVKVAREICEGGPVAIRAAVKAMEGWERGENSENEAYDMVVGTEDRNEALRAFGEKRKPSFKGR